MEKFNKSIANFEEFKLNNLGYIIGGGIDDPTEGDDEKKKKEKEKEPEPTPSLPTISIFGSSEPTKEIKDQ